MKNYSFLEEYILLYPKSIDKKIIEIVYEQCGYLYGKDFTETTVLSDIMDTVDFLEILSKISKFYKIKTDFPQKIYQFSKNLSNVTFEQFIYIVKEYIKYYSVNKKDYSRETDVGKITTIL